MHIRSATPADVEQVLPMVAQICAMHDRLDPARYAMLPDVVDRYRSWLPRRAEDPRSVFLVADASPTLVGFLIATIETNIPIYQLEEFAFIHDVWVDPRHRRGGVARGLVAEAVRRFKAIGVKQVRLETAAANDDARHLFAACGFRVGTVDMLMEL